MANYDMTPLDVGQRLRIKIRVVNDTLSINEERMISILPDFNVAELKFEIENTLSIKIEQQKRLIIPSAKVTANKEDSIATNDYVLEDEDMKLTKFTFTKNSVIICELKDDTEWNGADHIAIDVAPVSKPLKPTPRGPNNPKSKPKASAAPSLAAQSSSASDEELHFLTKHSKIQCRVLLVVFEITLILLVAYWGTVNMIQYSINMIFVLVAWRGCRKLKPFWIICFLLYLVMDLIIIFLLIILGLVEQHESVYGSTAAYITLLSLELVLNGTWLYFYSKFFYAVLRASETKRKQARIITSKQPILV